MLLVARNCKCSKGVNNVLCVVRSCIKYGIANHALRWNHSCIKIYATIWNNAPCCTKSKERRLAKLYWNKGCNALWWELNPQIPRLLADLPLVYTTHYCAPPYIPAKKSQMHFLISINTTGRVIVLFFAIHNKPKQITCFYVWFNHILQIAWYALNLCESLT